MELKKINWKAIAVVAIMTVFMFSVFQSATFASNSMNNNVSSLMPQSSANYVKIPGGSTLGNSLVKKNGPAVQSISNNGGYVKYTLNLSDNKLINGNYLTYSQSKIEPFGVTFDSMNGNLYVADFGTNNTTVIDSSNNSVIKTVPVADAPTASAVNSSNGNVYVTSFEYHGNVSVINGNTNTVLKTIPVGTGPDAIAYDSSNGYVYVSNMEGNSISVINGNTNTVVKTITVGTGPDGIAFDSSNGYVYVADSSSNIVSVINGSTNTVVKTITVGNGPDGIAFDSSNGYVYVSNYISSNVSVINGSTNTVVKTIPVGIDPQAVAFDSSNGNLYVTDAYSGMVSIIATTPISEYTVTFKESGLPTSTPWAVELNGTLKSSTNSTISFLEPNGIFGFGVQPITGYSVTHQNGTVIVNNSSTSNSITFRPISTQPPVWAFVGAYANYTLTWAYKGKSTTVNLTEKVISVNMNNDTAELQQMITQNTGSNIQNMTIYDHWNNFSIWLGRGLISQMNNGSLPGFSSKNISIYMKVTTPAGTFLTDDLYIAVNGTAANIYYEMYSGILVNENVTNSTGSANLVLTSTNIPEGNSVLSNYCTTFTESGLPAGTAWYVNLSNGMKSGSITGSSYSFSLTNGIYRFTIASTDKIYGPSPSYGYFYVRGNSVSKSVSFTEVKYTVTFTESGLPSGTAWYANLSNGMKSGSITGSSYSFSLTDGTYSYTIATTDKIYGPSPSSGSFTVNGSSVSKSVSFTEVKYTVTFTESGLPSGTHWSMTFNGATSGSNGTTITFDAVNGTYSYTVSNVSGYSVSSGSISVNGANIAKNVTFTALPAAGLSQTELYGITGAIVAVIAVVGLVAFFRRK